MRARANIAGVVLGVVMVGAGASLLVPRWGPKREAAPPESRRSASPPSTSKDGDAPHFLIESARDDASRAVRVARPREDTPD